ncbi:MAG: hypothetical protein R6U38_17825 [Desulfatiglandaceae bacterium]
MIEKNIPVAIRMDPLFPRSIEGCPEYQSLKEDLQPLVSWAAQTGVSYVISSPLKLVYRRNTVSWFNRSIIEGFSEVRRNYRRMAQDLQKKLFSDAQDLCRHHGLSLEHCFDNILKRNEGFVT